MPMPDPAAQRVVVVDTYSLHSVKVDVWCKDQLLGRATAFCMRADGKDFFVTNWHVVSGRNFQTKEPCDRYGRTPTALTFRMHAVEGASQDITWKLSSDEGKPTWLEHPELGSGFDVAAFEFPVGLAPPCYSSYDPVRSSNEDMAVMPAMTVSIVGFPLGMAGPATLPIWKTGHIATDLTMDCKEGPCFYVDATTRGGMSGSPVFLTAFGQYTSTINNGVSVFAGPRAVRWLGIYSGRISDTSEIGIVWRSEAVLNLLRNGRAPG
jgi:hypothetical protein